MDETPKVAKKKPKGQIRDITILNNSATRSISSRVMLQRRKRADRGGGVNNSQHVVVSAVSGGRA